MTSEAEQREREAAGLRADVGHLSKAHEVLKGLALVDPAEEHRLGQVEAAIKEKTGRLAELALEGKEAR